MTVERQQPVQQPLLVPVQHAGRLAGLSFSITGLGSSTAAVKEMKTVCHKCEAMTFHRKPTAHDHV